jgi:hypothetical protein
LLYSKVLGFTRTDFTYVEFRPPDQFLQLTSTIAGPMRMRSTFREQDAGTPRVRCEKTAHVEFHLSWFAYPFRRLIEWAFRRTSARLLAEDGRILERRRRLFGESIEDYLRDGQYLMCKEEFRAAFSNRAGGGPGPG